MIGRLLWKLFDLDSLRASAPHCFDGKLARESADACVEEIASASASEVFGHRPSAIASDDLERQAA